MLAPSPERRTTMNKRLSLLATLALLTTTASFAAQVDDATAVAMAKPHELVVAGDLSPAQRAALLSPVDAFYGFWNNGSAALLQKALSRDFVDHTLPAGRPQGPTGPAIASKGFLGAVPDLAATVVQRVVVGDRVVSHLRFTGHFTGILMGRRGTGQPIDFIATDILRVHDGQITDNWHLEDNLTFMQQVGLLPTP
jgi:predicted ester cyclase